MFEIKLRIECFYNRIVLGMQKYYYKCNRLMLLSAIFGIIGGILIALHLGDTAVVAGYIFYIGSDVGFLASCYLYKNNREQVPMWVIYLCISLIGIIMWVR